MPNTRAGDRHTKAITRSLIRDPKKKAAREARNALKQFDFGIEIIRAAAKKQPPFRLTSGLILQLHQLCLDGLDVFAGTFRNSPVKIGESGHTPPAHHLVSGLVQEMCDYVNKNWRRRKPMHLCAYVMWRMNWIHPFSDGNGRTSRVMSYIVLCARLGYELPGGLTIPEQIASNKTPYYKALEAADKAEKAGKINVEKLEALLATLLAKQLVSVHRSATGTSANPRRVAKKLH